MLSAQCFGERYIAEELHVTAERRALDVGCSMLDVSTRLPLTMQVVVAMFRALFTRKPSQKYEPSL